jgi:hypothetical protein
MNTVNSTHQTFIVEKTRTGFSAYSPDYPVFTTGKDMTELKANCLEALHIHFGESKPNICPSEISLKIDIRQFFRHYRVINARFLANRIGMNASLLSQYIHGTKQPSAIQQQKILHGLREIGKELSEIDFSQP